MVGINLKMLGREGKEETLEDEIKVNHHLKVCEKESIRRTTIVKELTKASSKRTACKLKHRDTET